MVGQSTDGGWTMIRRFGKQKQAGLRAGKGETARPTMGWLASIDYGFIFPHSATAAFGVAGLFSLPALIKSHNETLANQMGENAETGKQRKHRHLLETWRTFYES